MSDVVLYYFFGPKKTESAQKTAHHFQISPKIRNPQPLKIFRNRLSKLAQLCVKSAALATLLLRPYASYSDQTADRYRLLLPTLFSFTLPS